MKSRHLSTDLFYGNILVIKSGPDGDIQSLSQSDYEEFYNTAYGGFESLGSDDSLDDEEEENEYSIGSFVVNDTDPIEYEEEEEEEEIKFIPSSEEDEDDTEENVPTGPVRRSSRLQQHREIEKDLLAKTQVE